MAADMISRLAFVVALGGLAAAVSAAPDQSRIPLPQYHIYAGNTHSHTTNT
jgi:hypothetical protein